MSKHTPTPWAASGGAGIVTLCGDTEELKSGRTAKKRVACAKGASIEEVSANVDLIVRAVNSHDALVEALKALVWASPHHWQGTAEYGPAWRAARDLLKSLDAKP